MATMTPVPPTPGDDSVDPLFQSRTNLLTTIRLNTMNDEQTIALVNQAMTDVRVEFYEELGAARVTEILGFTDATNPTSENEIIRARAKITECYWVTYKLVPLLPMLFMETSHNVNENFNEEPLTRDSDEVKEFMDHLWKMVQKGLGAIASPAEVVDSDTAAAVTGAAVNNTNPYIVSEQFVGLYWGELDYETPDIDSNTDDD